MGFGEDAGLLDFGVPAGLGRLWEGPGVNLVLSPAVNDFALALPKESKYIGLVKTKSGGDDCARNTSGKKSSATQGLISEEMFPL